MVLTARLYLAGHSSGSEGIPLLTCNFSFSQEIDDRGLPKSGVRGGVINLSFESMDDEDIVWWMISKNADKDGKITFAGEEGEKVFKTLEFKDARCVAYQESFVRDVEMIQEITISAREIIVSGATFSNSWTKYNVQD